MILARQFVALADDLISVYKAFIERPGPKISWFMAVQFFLLRDQVIIPTQEQIRQR